MKIVKKRKSDQEDVRSLLASPAPWKVLIVDDEADIHSMTRLALDDFEFAGKKLQIFQAMSGIEAQKILQEEPKIAVALIDVVMETDDAGLRLIDFIRNEQQSKLIRLIIRTGQPGMAPERMVIEHYDIDDYKDKTDMTAERLYTTMRIALKSYRDLSTLEANRKALTKILEVAPELYHPTSINQFFQGILSQIIGLCNLGEASFISTASNGLAIAKKDNDMMVQVGTGRFTDPSHNPEVAKILEIGSKILSGEVTEGLDLLPPNTLLVPIKTHDNLIGFIYLEDVYFLSEANQKLIHVFINQCTSALDNLELYHELKKANQNTSQLLVAAEQSREMAEAANRAKSIFLAKMSHELRTPLNAIIGYSDIIQEDAEELGCSNILPDLEKIQTAGRQLLAIISDILDISKIEANKLEIHNSEFAVNHLIDEVLVTIQPLLNNGNTLKIECCGELGIINTDYDKLRQVLLNLLSNAIKFTTNGTITFNVMRYKNEPSIAQLSISPLSFTDCEDSDYLVFKVIDTGIGIAPNQIEIIFDPFIQGDNSSTRRFGGTGLGLSISRHFCQSIGGELFVDSTLGEGSTFTVRIPVQASSPGSQFDDKI